MSTPMKLEMGNSQFIEVYHNCIYTAKDIQRSEPRIGSERNLTEAATAADPRRPRRGGGEPAGIVGSVVAKGPAVGRRGRCSGMA